MILVLIVCSLNTLTLLIRDYFSLVCSLVLSFISFPLRGVGSATDMCIEREDICRLGCQRLRETCCFRLARWP